LLNAYVQEKKPRNEEFIPENNGQDQNSDLDDSVVGEENSAEIVKKLREKLKRTEQEKMEYLTGWKRAQADMVNARQRDEEEAHVVREVCKFRPDRRPHSGSRQFRHGNGDKEAWEKADKNWRIGVEYIYNQLLKVLTEHGVQEINPLNQPFDTSKHEAIEYEPVDDPKLDHVVTNVIQKGYALNGKIIKPAKVKVGEYKK